MKVEASAPSNIALIKYMGKSQTQGNLPANSSLSYTLENLRSFVVVEAGFDNDTWAPLPGFAPISLSETGLNKFLSHFQFLKQHWHIPGGYKILSANNFPSDCGLASSASSFAALTLATYELAKATHWDLQESPEELSRLSRAGSGSSCRSMFSPWAQWSSEGAEAWDCPVRFEHAVVIVEGEKKAVSSSQAHQRVNSSLLFLYRASRAEKRLIELKVALMKQDWPQVYELCWSEFFDMHALFETSSPSFGYMTGETWKALEKFRAIWREHGDGPIVTMDAGANIHLLIRSEQTKKADEWLHGFKVIKSWSE